jgi:aspartyl/asparaginyl-tRNA synthetase
MRRFWVERGFVEIPSPKLAERFGARARDAFGVENRVPALPFPRMTLAAAHEALARAGHVVSREGGDLDPEGERLLGAHVRRESGRDFVFVTDWPATVRPFYWRCSTGRTCGR